MGRHEPRLRRYVASGCSSLPYRPAAVGETDGVAIFSFAWTTIGISFSKREAPSLNAKRISPHVIRHTTATHLLQAGVDINTIRAWLGHVSIDTTSIYAETDLATKKRALATLDRGQSGKNPQAGWARKPDVLAFLRTL